MMHTNIKKYREKIGLTQEELANKAGVSRLTIINLENGLTSDVKASTLKKISEVLGKPMDDCFSFTYKV
jgi:DNA-binding XRE family transcriptional regulator